MKENSQKNKETLLIATHDQNVANIADVIIMMKDGRIISIK